MPAQGNNAIFIQGVIGHDLDLREVNGQSVVNMRIAVDDGYWDKTEDKWVDRTIWMPCTIWGEAAERACKALGKGQRISAIGKLWIETTPPEEEGGEWKTRANIDISNWKFAGRKVTKKSDDETDDSDVDF